MTSHLKIAIRNLRKYPVFSLINLGGLSIGIAASFILLVYAQRELTTDAHFKDPDRIARISTDFFDLGGLAQSQSGLRNLVQETSKDVESATCFDKAYDEVPVRTRAGDRAYTGIHPYYIDTAFFKIFNFETAAGALPGNGLQQGEAVITQTYARRFFGKEDAMGKTLLIGKDNTPYKIIAVIKDRFERSHMDAQLLIALDPRDAYGYPTQWASAGLYTYVKLKPAGTMAGLQSTLDWILKKSVSKDLAYQHIKLFVQPLKDIYFHSHFLAELTPGGNLTQVRLLGIIGIFLILLAIINYVNLVTARASTRSREFGLKKTFGASRRQLAGQLIVESIFFSLIAMALSIALIRVIGLLYHYATGVSLTGELPLMLTQYGWLVLFSLVVGIIAGMYPAIYLTAIRPLLSLRAIISQSGRSNPGVRNTLVLVQFSIAAALVFASFVVYTQLKYINEKDKGFQAEGVLLVDGFRDQEAFRHLIDQQSQVVSSSYCNRTPAGKTVWVNTYKKEGSFDNKTLQTFPVDERFLSTMGIRLTQGRNFNKDLITDTNSLILNESAVAALGLFDPVGTTLNGSERIIGVIRDFNYNSLHEKVAPAILRYAPKGNILAIRVKTGHTANFLQWLQQKGKHFQPEAPLSVSYLDDNFKALAEKDRLLGKAIAFFTVLAIILASLGLTGLTLFTVERRTREIGVRKVLGATAADILALVSKDFVKLTFVASAVALPLSWWLVHRWLENFAYRVTISWWIFVVTEVVLLLIALTVICVLALKAATVSPVKSIRTE